MIKESRENGVNVYEISRGCHTPPLKFGGELLAKVKNDCNSINIYKTVGGKLICAEFDPDISDIAWSVYICDTMDEIVKHLGYKPLATDLYNKIGIQYWETVE